MLLSGGLLALTLSTASASAAPLHATVGTLPPLSTSVGATIAGSPTELSLRSPLLDSAAQIESRSIGDDRLTSHRRSSGATTGSVRAQTASAEPTASDAPPASEAPAAEAASEAPAEEEPSIDLLRQRARMTRVHRPLGIATWSGLLVTEALGTIMAINQRTWFGPGNCSNVSPTGASGCIFGDWGASGLGTMHEVSAFVTLGLYTATGIYALAMPDPEHASAGNDPRARRLRIHKALAWVHLVGMVLQPILGIMAASPTAFGLSTTPSPGSTSSPAQDFSASLRTIHMGVGYVTFAALTGAMIDELLQ